MKNYAEIEITDPVTGKHAIIPTSDYELIANHVRQQDRKDYAREVLINGLTCQDSRLSNVENYILANDSLLTDFSESLDDAIHADTGEKEYMEVDDWKSEHQVAFYKAISKGTDYEQEDTVILSKDQADAIMAKNWKGCLQTTDGDDIDTAYISEITFINLYED